MKLKKAGDNDVVAVKDMPIKSVGVVALSPIIDAYLGNLVYRAERTLLVDLTDGGKWDNLEDLNFKVRILPPGTEIVV